MTSFKSMAFSISTQMSECLSPVYKIITCFTLPSISNSLKAAILYCFLANEHGKRLASKSPGAKKCSKIPYPLTESTNIPDSGKRVLVYKSIDSKLVLPFLQAASVTHCPTSICFSMVCEKPTNVKQTNKVVSKPIN